MKFLIFCGLVITMTLLLIKQVKSDCSASNKACMWDILPKTPENCAEHAPKCNWCEDETKYRRCQTHDRSCLVTDLWKITCEDAGGNERDCTEQECIDKGGVYCDGDEEQCCICPEPIDFICHQPGGLNPCPNADLDADRKECHEAGCVYCGDDAVESRKGKCWKLPQVVCPDGSQCCKERRCIDKEDPDPVECKNLGCHICTINDKKWCNYGRDPTAVPCPNDEVCCVERKCGPPDITKDVCEALGCHMCCDKNDEIMCNYGEDPNPGSCDVCGFDCFWDKLPTPETCKSRPLCMYCEEFKPFDLRCQTTDRSCLVANPWVLDGNLNEQACIEEGGVFCNGDYKELCICKERAREICFDAKLPLPCPMDTMGKADCHAAGCVYCDTDAIEARRHQCWRMPCHMECEDNKACCKERHCMPGYDPDETECKAMGCVICWTDDNRKLCNFPQQCENNEVCCKRRRCGKPGITKDECDQLGCHMCCDDNGEIMCNHGPDPNPGQCIEDDDARFDCIKGFPRNADNCRSLAPQCMFCSGFKKKLKCQTDDRSCLVKDRWHLKEHRTKSGCTDAGGVFCNGDYKEMCICPEPARQFCYKEGKKDRCAGNPKTEKECHEKCCLWCDGDAFSNREYRCWEMPAAATCTSEGETCCKERRCMNGYNPDETVCLAKSCEICEIAVGDEMKKLCVYPSCAGRR